MRLEDSTAQNSKLLEEKNILERMVRESNEVKAAQKVENGKLLEDNQKLNKICQDQEKQIKNLEAERIKLLSRNDELNFELKNVNGKLKSREENLSYTSRQLEDSKNANLKLTQTLKDYEKQNDLQRGENNTLNANLQKERTGRIEAEKSNEHLQILLNERDREINRLLNELDSSRLLNQRVNDEKLNMSAENERLKNHIMVLTEQNQKVGVTVLKLILILYFKIIIIFFSSSRKSKILSTTMKESDNNLPVRKELRPYSELTSLILKKVLVI
jgi:chromosome segregation ATPase